MSILDRLRKKIENCPVCKGSGVSLEDRSEGLTFVDCKCVDDIKNNIDLIKANIPEQYWGYSLDNLSKRYKKANEKTLQIVAKYIEELDKNIACGKGLWFCSPPGLGKSIVTCLILREAINKNYSSYFIRASHMIDLKFKALRDEEASNEVSRIIKHVDVLAVDELEKIYLSNEEAMNSQLFYDFISEVYASKKALLISSNRTKKEVMLKFPTYIQDRLKTIPAIVFRGKSERVIKSALV